MYEYLFIFTLFLIEIPVCKQCSSFFFFFFFSFFLSAPPPLSDTRFFRISCEIMYVLFTNLQSVINKKEIMRVCMYVSMLHTPTHAHAHTHTHDGN